MLCDSSSLFELSLYHHRSIWCIASSASSFSSSSNIFNEDSSYSQREKEKERFYAWFLYQKLTHFSFFHLPLFIGILFLSLSLSLLHLLEGGRLLFWLIFGAKLSIDVRKECKFVLDNFLLVLMEWIFFHDLTQIITYVLNEWKSRERERGRKGEKYRERKKERKGEKKELYVLISFKFCHPWRKVMNYSTIDFFFFLSSLFLSSFSSSSFSSSSSPSLSLFEFLRQNILNVGNRIFWTDSLEYSLDVNYHIFMICSLGFSF